ncbi:hypothetical protein CVS40_6808 [Lucilia cuprina]|nr:hypothetical protein CVS40_6808 [Lucilia cuprina]
MGEPDKSKSKSKLNVIKGKQKFVYTHSHLATDIQYTYVCSMYNNSSILYNGGMDRWMDGWLFSGMDGWMM